MVARKKVKAVSYLRVSGKGQIDGDGFDRQREAIEKYAKHAKLDLIEEYAEQGVTGTTSDLEQRVALARLLDRVENNGVKVVIVEYSHRLARDLTTQGVILNKLRQAGVSVFDSEGIDLTNDEDPQAKLIRQILGAIAEFDKNVTVLKLRAARERIRNAGERCEGRKPFGHNPNEKPVLDRIKQLRRKPRGGEKLSYHKVAKTLNKEGAISRSGKPWTAMSVQRIAQRHGW